jgi:hypothetical protein
LSHAQQLLSAISLRGDPFSDTALPRIVFDDDTRKLPAVR